MYICVRACFIHSGLDFITCALDDIGVNNILRTTVKAEVRSAAVTCKSTRDKILLSKL